MLSTYSVCTAKKTDIRSSDRKSKASFGQMSGRRFTFFLVWPVGRIRSGWRGSAVGSVECWWGGRMGTGLPKGASGCSRRSFRGRSFGLRPHALPQDYGRGWIGELAPCAGRSVKTLSTLGKTILTLENSILTLEKTVSTLVFSNVLTVFLCVHCVGGAMSGGSN